MKTMLFALALAALVLCAARSRAEDWRVLSDVNLTLTQNAYSDNWAGGESGSMSWTLNSNTIAEKQILKGVFNKNTLKLSYGLTYNQDTETNTWDSGNKSTDLIDLESTFRWTLGTFVEPIIAFRGITQFVDQSEDAIDDALLPANASKKDRLFNPLDLTESVGVARVFVKEETREWQARLGVAAKQIVNRDALDLSSGNRETLTQYDGGFEFVNDLRWPLADDKILWTSKLTVFEGVFSSISDEVEGTEQENYWKYPDVNFENIFTSDITKYISVNLYVQLLYDRQIDRDARLKQTLALGFTYKLL